MADHTVHLGYDESLDIILPDGQKVNVVLSYLEPGEQLPELDIMLPKIMAANCYGKGLAPAEVHSSGDQSVRLAKQIIVPIPPKRKRKAKAQALTA